MSCQNVDKRRDQNMWIHTDKPTGNHLKYQADSATVGRDMITEKQV